MTTLVQRNGAFALKMFAGGNAPMADLVLALASRLRLAGVTVPETSKDTLTGALRQPWIDGLTLCESLVAAGPMTTAIEFAQHKQHFKGVMNVVGKLHGASACSDGLQSFKPFRLVDRRLNALPPGRLSLGNRRLAGEIRAQLGACLATFPMTGPVHGDLHARQVIQDKTTGVWWLIDLDDVALGSPEVDIGNFCAHIASTPAINGTSVNHAFEIMTALCLDTYDGSLAQRSINLFGSAALVRRALKCAEQLGSQARVEMILLAAQHLIQIGCNSVSQSAVVETGAS
jgi:Phosphotransferase enzyme family